MVNHKRRKRLLKLLAEHQTATVSQLVDWLNAFAAGTNLRPWLFFEMIGSSPM